MNRVNQLAVKLYDVRLYLSFLDEQKLSRNTISRTLSSLRGFYHFLIRNDLLDENPLSYISFKKKQLRLPQYLYEEGVGKLLRAEGTEMLTIANRALVELFYDRESVSASARTIQATGCALRIGCHFNFRKRKQRTLCALRFIMPRCPQEYLEMTRTELIQNTT